MLYTTKDRGWLVVRLIFIARGTASAWRPIRTLADVIAQAARGYYKYLSGYQSKILAKPHTGKERPHPSTATGVWVQPPALPPPHTRLGR